jgi:prephenate dehydrogenase
LVTLERLGTVAIVGVGLIGGSIGRALRVRGLADRVVGVGRDEARLAEARRLGAIDEGTTGLAAGVADAEVVVVCTPVSRIAEDVAAAAAHGPDGALITDAGSTKGAIVAEVEADPRSRAAFVGAHPVAGSERQGVAHARADLFDGRACVLTPTDRTPPDRLQRARRFWRALGCRLVEMGPAAHDAELALTSHLPHAVAAALAATVPVEALPLAAGAYRDGTRVAGSDPDLWAAIFLQNRASLLDAIAAFEGRLGDLRHALAASDAGAIRDWWASARSRRLRFDDRAPTTESPAPEI